MTTIGSTVSDLVVGLRRQPVLDVSRPVPVRVDGHRGVYVKVTIPDTVDAASCVDSTVALFSINGDDDGWGWEQGFVGLWWIVNVDGARVVVNGQCDTDCSKADVATLTEMAKSVAFRPGQ
jgi:hypothetical protein